MSGTSAILNGRQVGRISAYLVAGDLDDAPKRLAANAKKAFIGSYVLGAGFTFDDGAAAKAECENLKTMRMLITKEPRNADRIFPYIGGEEVNTSPTHAYNRYVIGLSDLPLRRDDSLMSWFMHEGTVACNQRRQECLQNGIVPADYPDEVAEDWPDLLAVVERWVKPQRIALPSTNAWNRTVSKYWWRWGAYRKELNRALAGLKRYIFVPNLSPHLLAAFIAADVVTGAPHNVVAFPTMAPFAVLQSRIHEIWARFFSSTLEDRLRYAPSDCFETFPFPAGYETDAALEAAGQTYHDHRAALMIAANEGMTKTYNRFHDSEERGAVIQTLRDLHGEMDRAVLHAYGWDDLATELSPEFLTEDSENDHTYQGRYFLPAEGRDRVLARLLALNVERHAVEVAEGRVPADRAQPKDTENEDGEPQLDLS
jgi:hypothetical protein